MFFLTEFALHTHLNAFGAGTMTALYAAAMFINGCGYLLFPLLARTQMAAAHKNRFVPAAAALFVFSAALAENFRAAGAEAAVLVRRDGFGRLPRRRVALGRGRRAAPDRMTGKLYAAAVATSVAVQYPIQNYFAAPQLPPRCGRPQPRPSSSGPCRRRPASRRAASRRKNAERPPPILSSPQRWSCSSATSTASGTAC